MGEPAAATLSSCPHCGNDHGPSTLRCPQTDLSLPLQGRLLAGRFRFAYQLGQGGMATVWAATNELVDREVAIKLIRPDVGRSPELVARFRSEAKAAGRIGHPNICDILDYGVGALGPYMVMELLEGESLGALLEREGRLEPEHAISLIREALQGLQAAHERGIIHRDLKPENIFLNRVETGAIQVKIMDFGIAKFTDGTAEVQTESGALLGTPEYMAPEQFRGADQADTRTDLWAMGAILYRALSGRDAFTGPTTAAILLSVAQDPPPTIRAVAPEVPAELEQLVMRCLSKSPVDRFQSVSALDAALEPFDRPDSGSSSWMDEPSSSESHASLVRARRTPTGRQRPSGLARPSAWDRRAWGLIGLVVGGLALGGGLLFRMSSDGAPLDPPAATVDTPAVAAVVDPGASERSDDRARPEPPTEPGSEARDEGSEEANPSDPAAPDAAEPEPAGPEEAIATPTAPALLRAGEFVALPQLGERVHHGRARAVCRRLAETQHLGVATWTVPNPKIAKLFANIEGAPQGLIWTSALWKGRALALDLASSKTRSIRARKRAARWWCVAHAPTEGAGESP